MGVRGLKTYLLKYATHFGSLDSYVNYLKETLNKKNIHCSIDCLNMLYDAKKLGADDFIIIIYNHLVKLLNLGIIVSFCMDGVAGVEKSPELKIRRDQKRQDKRELKELLKLNNIGNDTTQVEQPYSLHSNKIQNKIDELKKKVVKITKTNMIMFKKLCEILHIPIYQALGEADSLLSKLSIEGKCDFVISGDMDMLTFGCLRVVKIEDNDEIYEFNKDNILKNLKVTLDQFIDMCILKGCDYAKSHPHMTLEEAQNYILKHENIENILNVPELSVNDEFIEEYKIARHVYNNSKDLETIEYEFKMNEIINPLNLITFFENNISSKLSLDEKNNIFHSIKQYNITLLKNKQYSCNTKTNEQLTSFICSSSSSSQQLIQTNTSNDKFLNDTLTMNIVSNSTSELISGSAQYPLKFTLKRVKKKLNFISVQCANENNTVMCCSPLQS